jgi:hypothetical protein
MGVVSGCGLRGTGRDGEGGGDESCEGEEGEVHGEVR